MTFHFKKLQDLKGKHYKRKFPVAQINKHSEAVNILAK